MNWYETLAKPSWTPPAATFGTVWSILGRWAWQWLVLLIFSVAVTFGLYEVVRRIAALRFLFGMRSTTRALPGVTA